MICWLRIMRTYSSVVSGWAHYCDNVPKSYASFFLDVSCEASILLSRWSLNLSLPLRTFHQDQQNFFCSVEPLQADVTCSNMVKEWVCY